MISIYHTQEGDVMCNCYCKKHEKFYFYFAINITFFTHINSAYLFCDTLYFMALTAFFAPIKSSFLNLYFYCPSAKFDYGWINCIDQTDSSAVLNLFYMFDASS